MRNWRKMTWAILVWTILMFAWMIGGGSSADCGSITDEAEKLGCEAGTGIGVALLFVLWFVGFIILTLIWFMTRPKGRTCPACGENVKKGRTACPGCGYDFAGAARSGPSASPTT